MEKRLWFPSLALRIVTICCFLYGVLCSVIEIMTDIVSLSISEGAHFCSFGFENKFCVYSLSPLKLQFTKHIINYSLNCLSTNSDGILTAFSVTPLLPNSPNQKVFIWNNFYDEEDGCLEFKEVVRCVCIRKKVLVIVLTDSVCLYDIQNHRYTGFEQITFHNLSGACDVSFNEDNPKIAICGLTPGAVQIFSENEDSLPIFFSAHIHPISMIKLSSDSRFIATASEQGTIIRVFDGISGSLRCVFRRGNLKSKILAMCFSPDNKKLLAISQNGTLHLFDTETQQSSEENPVKSISKLSLHQATCYAISYQNDNEIVIISSSGIVTKIRCCDLKLTLIGNQLALSH